MANRPTDYAQTLRNAKESRLRELQALGEQLVGGWFWTVRVCVPGPNDILVGVVLSATEEHVVLQCSGRRRRMGWPLFQREWKRWQNAPPRPVVLRNELLWIGEAR